MSVPQAEPLGTILFSSSVAARPAADFVLSATFLFINFWHSFSSLDLAMCCNFDYRVDPRMEAVGRVSFSNVFSFLARLQFSLPLERTNVRITNFV